MRPILSILATIIFTVLILRHSIEQEAPKKSCVGYTLIEHGRAVNACGDTVVVEKSKYMIYE
jgi:hypothetical protein